MLAILTIDPGCSAAIPARAESSVLFRACGRSERSIQMACYRYTVRHVLACRARSLRSGPGHPLVVLLGLRTAAAHPEPIIVAVFGIVAALLGPTAISLVAGAFPSRRSKALDQLAKAGEIEQRVAEAETMQQKVRALEDERRRLATIIRFEARRQLVLDRQEVLQSEVQQLTQQAEQVLAELKAIEEEGRLLGEEIDNSAAKRDIMAVRERLKRERTG